MGQLIDGTDSGQGFSMTNSTSSINQPTNETTPITNEDIPGIDMGCWQLNYQLREVEFERIKNGKSFLSDWSRIILIAGIGYSFQLARPLVNFFKSGEFDYTSHSTVIETSLLFILISVILFIVSYIVPSEKSKVLKKIQTHFDQAAVEHTGRRKK